MVKNWQKYQIYVPDGKNTWKNCKTRKKNQQMKIRIVNPEDKDSIRPDIMYNEYDKALSELTNGKSEDMDNIPAELCMR